jgi:hypothetical protein
MRAPASLHTRLGRYDAIAAIAAVVDGLIGRLRSDALIRQYRTSPPER